MRQLKITNKITNRESVALEKYLNDIAKIDLITADEEIRLAKLRLTVGWPLLDAIWNLISRTTRVLDVKVNLL